MPACAIGTAESLDYRIRGVPHTSFAGAGPDLRVDPALLDGECHPVDGQHVRRDAVIDTVRLGVADYLIERVHHDGLELVVDHRLLPEISLAVLHPLEVTGGHATGVGQNVGDHKDFLVSQHFIGGRGGWTVGAFRDGLRLDVVHVLRGDHVLGGRRYQDIALVDQKV